jgi:DNA repair exonuclease SbcCD ATPase subunit
MASEFDHSDFVDSEFVTGRPSANAGTPVRSDAGTPGRPPSREELEAKVSETQQRLIELKHAQESLERERAALEEARRRQAEFQTGREETLQNLIRGLGLLGEAELAARRDAEQMAKTLAGFREALEKVQAIHQETWNTENYNTELTRALTALENARMEWNAARLKWPLLDGDQNSELPKQSTPALNLHNLIEGGGFRDICRVGLGLTWPVALAVLLVLLVLLFR